MEIKWNKHVVVLYDENKDEQVATALKAHIEREYDPCDVILVKSSSYTVSSIYKYKRLVNKFKARHLRKALSHSSKQAYKRDVKRIQELLRTNGYSDVESKRKIISVYRIVNIIRRFEPLVILCTTPEALKLTLIGRTVLGQDFRAVGVITEFFLDPAFVRAGADGYLVENPDVKKHLMNSGVPEEKILVVGYPTLLQDVKKDVEIKRAALGLTSDLPLVVVNGGEYDTYTLKKDIIKLMGKKNDYYLMIITKDKKLRKFYMNLPEFSAGVLINEDLTSDILDVTDILVTVPSTGVIFQAFVRGIAVIVSEGVLELEKNVRDYLVKRALVIPTRTPDETLFGVYEILDEPLRKNEFKYRGEVYVRLSVKDIKNITPRLSENGVLKISNKTIEGV